jgi:nicotinamidase-related amidase
MSTALVLIDLQNDYFPGGAMELVGADHAVAKAALLLQRFRKLSLPIFHIQHIANDPEATFFLPGTRGAAIHVSVAPFNGETVVVKHFPNGFRETTLLNDLRAAGVSKLVFAGMMTHMCVDTTVRAASDYGFQCFLALDGCATTSLQLLDQKVEAKAVQLAFLAALNDGFATVRTAQELYADI